MSDADAERVSAAALRALSRGDASAFDYFYARHSAALYRFLRRLVVRADAVDDLVQEAFLKLVLHAGELRADSDVKAWLFTIARRAWISRWRAHANEDAAACDELESDELDPERALLASVALSALESALQGLSTSDREVLLLVGVEGMSQETAARVLGIRHAALRQRLARARQRLARRLEPELAEGRLERGRR